MLTRDIEGLNEWTAEKREEEEAVDDKPQLPLHGHGYGRQSSMEWVGDIPSEGRET